MYNYGCSGWLQVVEIAVMCIEAGHILRLFACLKTCLTTLNLSHRSQLINVFQSAALSLTTNGKFKERIL